MFRPVVVDGMVFVNSGYSHHGAILPGNVLLAFSPEETSAHTWLRDSRAGSRDPAGALQRLIFIMETTSESSHA